MARGARRAGLPASAARGAATCTTTRPGATRCDPHLTRLLQRGVAMRRDQVELVRAGDRRRGHRHRLRPLRPAGARCSRPSAGGAWDFEGNGMVGAVADLIEAGRVKLYCVDSYDAASWSNRAIPLEERARAHDALRGVDPRAGRAVHPRRLRRRAGDRHRRRAASAPTTPPTSRSSAPTCSRSRSCLSGNYDPSHWHGWGERGEAAYFNNPIDYVAHLDGDHLDWLRSRREPAARLRPGPVGGHDRRARQHARARRRCSQRKGIRHELDLWGHDVPHDWPSWRAQLAHHLPRFC